MPGPIFFATISSAASSGVTKDFFQITGSTTYRLAIREISFGQHSEVGGSTETDFAAISIWRGSTAACAGGSTASPIKRDSRSSSATSILELNASSPSTGGSMIYASAWPLLDRFVWRPDPNERPIIGLGERLNVRCSSAADSFTWSGTIVWEEIGPSN